MLLKPFLEESLLAADGLDNNPVRNVGLDHVLEGAALFKNLPGRRADAQVFVVERYQAVVGVEERKTLL